MPPARFRINPPSPFGFGRTNPVESTIQPCSLESGLEKGERMGLDSATMNRKTFSQPIVVIAAIATILGAEFIPAVAQEAGTESLQAGEFTFKYGKPWEKMEVQSSMRAGQLKYNHSDEKLQDPELVFYYFGPGQGGGIEPNIERWIGQFEGEPKTERETVEVGGRKIHFLYAKGTYMESSGGPFSGTKTAKPNSMMLGAILESKEGAVFLKLTGEEKAVEAIKEAFIKLAKSPLGE
jgi:hypothetical protein